MVPLCYYPTRVVLIDDNEHFIETLKNGLINRGLDCVAFTNPHTALEFLRTIPQTNQFSFSNDTNNDDDANLPPYFQNKI